VEMHMALPGIIPRAARKTNNEKEESIGIICDPDLRFCRFSEGHKMINQQSFHNNGNKTEGIEN
jgi:hypothetical protein